jgi:hypothetical protein
MTGPVTAGALNTKFLTTYERVANDTPLTKICGKQAMDEFSKVLSGVGAVPGLSLFKGTCKFIGLEEEEITLTVDRYQGGFTYDRATPSHRIWGIVQPKINGLAKRTKNHGISLLTTTIAANPTCYDGKALFANDHPVSGGESTNDNLLAGSGTTLANITTDYWACLAALSAMKDSEGEIIDRYNFAVLIQCPPALREQFENLQKAVVISSTSNIVINRFDLWVDPRLSDANDWYMYITDEDSKPFVYGMYQEGLLETWEDKDNKLIKVSADIIHGIGPGDPTTTVKVVNS